MFSAIPPHCFALAALASTLLLASVASAETTTQQNPEVTSNSSIRIVEPVPDLQHVKPTAAHRTPSGLPLPRYVSLKYNTVNGRTGPSQDHPIAWRYQRRGLPLIVVSETEMWRKVRDIYGDESWIRKPALSGERSVITLDVTHLHKKPNDSTRVVAIAPENALLKLGKCEDTGWCRVSAESGEKGWAQRHFLWGAVPLS